jgi:uncharacterized protein (TIGR04255 family)
MPIANPLVDPPPAEVPLAKAPLVRVIAQVRFPVVAAVEQREFVAEFQKSLRTAYPVLREETARRFIVHGSDPAVFHPSRVWRFEDDEGRWRLSLMSDSLALETTAYSSRSDFLRRFDAALRCLEQHVKPARRDRLGIRYIDRITGEAAADIARLVRAEVRGIVGTPLGPRAVHSLSESLFDLDDLRLLARWGRLPPNVTVDPAAIEPVGESSWLLDLDAFADAPAAFSVDSIGRDARRFAERIYAFFRWAVTEEFLRKYGGKP